VRVVAPKGLRMSWAMAHSPATAAGPAMCRGQAAVEAVACGAVLRFNEDYAARLQVGGVSAAMLNCT
jgi:hypothetical protein